LHQGSATYAKQIMLKLMMTIVQKLFLIAKIKIVREYVIHVRVVTNYLLKVKTVNASLLFTIAKPKAPMELVQNVNPVKK